ncbi:MAG: sugar transferase [Bacteroidales bacterium]|nr:sugar transferase [Bacteroidales bacterium]
MGLKSYFNSWASRDNYDEVMEYLAVAETQHAPRFEFDDAPEQLRELIAMAETPRSPERSQWLNDYAKKSWEVPDGEAEVLLAEDHLNAIRYVNRYLRKANAKLKQDGYIVCAFDTSQKRRAQIFSKYPRFIARIVYFFDFLWHRVCPKLALTRRFYYFCNKKERKVFPRPEILGRLYYCGFEVVSEQYIHDRCCVIGQKKREPHSEPHTYGPLVRLRRVGKDGKIFNVYKFRTMYAYSEYLQTYVYENNDLDKGGKFSNDYRVTGWGRFLRKTWLDELPMLLNLIKGQMKLVGVRPLSRQYFSLYRPEMQELRIKTKPGLLPPFYVDMPETLDEIQESERRYLEAYLEHPFRTDWKYFWKIVGNIVFKGKRSK